MCLNSRHLKVYSKTPVGRNQSHFYLLFRAEEYLFFTFQGGKNYVTQ